MTWCMKSRFFPLILLSLSLFACSEETPTVAPLCKLETPEVQLVESDIPKEFEYEMNQQSLAQLMKLELESLQCFASHQQRLQIYQSKTPVPARKTLAPPKNDQERQSVDYFHQLPAPPPHLQNTWNIQSQNVPGTLKGLTTTDLYIINNHFSLNWAAITLRKDSRPWHLWHEYMHYLIRLKQLNANTFKKIPSETELKELAKQLSDLSTQLPNREQEFVAVLHKFMEKKSIHQRNFLIEELVIEATLIDLISINPDLIEFNYADIHESKNYIYQYADNYFFETGKILHSLSVVASQNNISEPLQNIVLGYSQDLEQRRTAINSLTEKVTQQANELMLKFFHQSKVSQKVVPHN